jgi:thioredoxin reductase
MPHDVIVVGAGPAGMSAALILGRCGRDVLALDSNEPRNHASPALHGFLTRDGVDPWKLRELGRADLTKYPSVTLRQAKVESARRSANGFEVSTQSGEIEQTRLLLLATGRIDPLPDIAGFREFYGRGVHHCPYCDGWEHRGKKLAVFGNGRPAEDLALELTTCSKDVVIYSNGKADWQPATVDSPWSRIRSPSSKATRAAFRPSSSPMESYSNVTPSFFAPNARSGPLCPDN